MYLSAARGLFVCVAFDRRLPPADVRSRESAGVVRIPKTSQRHRPASPACSF